jgi:hypothetical protein
LYYCEGNPPKSDDDKNHWSNGADVVDREQRHNHFYLTASTHGSAGSAIWCCGTGGSIWLRGVHYGGTEDSLGVAFWLSSQNREWLRQTLGSSKKRADGESTEQ